MPTLPASQVRVFGVLVGVSVLVGGYAIPILANQAGPFDDSRLPTLDRTEPGVERDLRDDLSTATVAHGKHACDRWTGSRWACGLDPWLWVGRYIGRATTPKGPEWRRCIWAHPTTRDGKTSPLTISFPDVPLADELRGEAALLDVPRPGAPVEFSIKVAGRQRTQVRLVDQDKRIWHPWSVRTAGMAGRSAEVLVEIKTADPNWRHVCFTALVVEVAER